MEKVNHKTIRSPSIVLFFIVLALSPSPAAADLVNLSGAENASNIAEIYIHSDHIRIGREVYVKDLAVFKELMEWCLT